MEARKAPGASRRLHPPLSQLQPSKSTLRNMSTQEELAFSPLASPASRFQSPGSEQARTTTAISGRRLFDSYKSFLPPESSPIGAFLKTLLESSRWNSTISYLTWKPSATPRGRLLFRLVPSMPDTDATEFGLWPTPQANKTTESGDIVNADGTEWDGMSKPHGAATGRPITTALADKVKMWPTPTSHLAKETNAPSEANRNEPSISSIVGGSLNPQFVEWLMGYPKEWTVAENFASGRKKICKPQESAPESNIAHTDCVG